MSKLTSFLKTMIGMDAAEAAPRIPDNQPATPPGPQPTFHAESPPPPPGKSEIDGEVEMVLRAFGIKRTRDLDRLLRPARGAAAYFWTIGMVLVLASVAAGSRFIADAATLLELGVAPHRLPAVLALGIGLLAAVAATRLVVRIRRAERRRLFIQLCGEWIQSPDADSIENHFASRFQISLKRIASGHRVPSTE